MRVGLLEELDTLCRHNLYAELAFRYKLTSSDYNFLRNVLALHNYHQHYMFDYTSPSRAILGVRDLALEDTLRIRNLFFVLVTRHKLSQMVRKNWRSELERHTFHQKNKTGYIFPSHSKCNVLVQVVLDKHHSRNLPFELEFLYM